MSLRACIEILGMTQVEAAAVFRVNPRTLRGWIGGRSDPPVGWRSILAAHVRGKQPPEHLDRLRQLAPQVVEVFDEDRREAMREARWKAKAAREACEEPHGPVNL
jgi:hypothetical protein